MFLLIIGLVVLGPEKLPDAIRRVGRLYAELKRMSSGVQKDLRQVMDEPIKEFMKTANTAKSLFTDTTSEFRAAANEIVEPKFIPYEANSPNTDDESTVDESTVDESTVDENTIDEGIASPEISKFSAGYIDPDDPDDPDDPELSIETEMNVLTELPSDHVLDDLT